ncbi:MAG: phosphoribosylglycinamide synthetase C domain-containing protein [archaeon]|jgi:phosphoribosylamine-glycine ligase
MFNKTEEQAVTPKENHNGTETKQKISTTANPKKFLFVSWESLSGDLAWEIKKEGHQVKCYIERKDDEDVYDGILDKVSDWKAEVDWADVIIFDDVGFGSDADELRAKGKLVVGGSKYTDKLEEDREFGQNEMKRVGMNILPHWDFTDFEEAIEFIKKTPERYVFKPSGTVASDQKGVLFLGQEEDGKDLIQILEQNKKIWARKIKKFQLQKMAVGVEVAVGAFFNGNDFIYPINVNFEHKKLFPGDIGPYTGEMGCYEEGTQVLTKNGWKDFANITFEDEFATLNPQDHDIKYQRPTSIVKFNHHKKLLKIKNQTIDLGVTLDHNMVGIEANKYRKGERQLEFVKAKELPNQFVVFRSSQYKGTSERFFVLPSEVIFHYEGKTVKGKSAPEKIIEMDEWIKFFGLWLAEGWTSTKGYQLGIAQSKPRVREKIREILQKLPFKFRETKDTFVCDDKQLWSYLRPLGDALEKYIPREYLQLSKEQLEILYNHMFLGDGNQSNKTRVYYTSSKRLADDVQELLLKIGKVGVISERLRKDGKIGERQFKEIHRSYEVLERIEKKVSWIDKRDTKTVEYEGNVYCVEVPNHSLYVKRNGKPVWCGNTLMFWSQPNEIFKITLSRLKEDLIKSKYVGYIDINCIANAKGIFPLEFTCRFGYPTISIQLEGITSEAGETMYRLAKGEAFELKTKKGFQIGICVVVPPFPFDDPKEAFIYKDLSILFKKPNYEGVHLGDVKIINDIWTIAGDSGYVLVVTASGITVEEARKQAYSRVKNIMIQNMYYRTDIGAKWPSDSDKLHTEGYLY